MEFLRSQSWDHFYLIYLLMISLTLVVDANFRLYADDTMQYLSNHNPNALEFTSQNSFDVLQSRFECNYLNVNECYLWVTIQHIS